MLRVLSQSHQKFLYPLLLTYNLQEKQKVSFLINNSNEQHKDAFCSVKNVNSTSFLAMRRTGEKNVYALFIPVRVYSSNRKNSLDLINDNLHVCDVNQMIDYLWKFETYYH